MDNLFHIIDGAQVIMRSRGVFHQKKVYIRGDRLFAGWGTGFVRIGPHDSTSAPNVSGETIDLPNHVRMCSKTVQATLIPAQGRVAV